MAVAVTNEVTLEFLEAFGAAWNRHDVDAIMASMADDCVFDITAGPEVVGKRYEGRERVRQAVARVFSIWPDARFGSAVHFVCGDRGVSEWVFTGTREDGTVFAQQGAFSGQILAFDVNSGVATTGSFGSASIVSARWRLALYVSRRDRLQAIAAGQRAIRN